VLIAAIGTVLAACSVTPESHPAGIASKTSPRITETTSAPPFSVPPAPDCVGGTVTLPFQHPGVPVSACVKVGSTLVWTGGGTGTGGTWPGPLSNSDPEVLSLLSSEGGTEFTARFRAIGVGTAQVAVPFVNGPDICQPTPCTPIPGTPLDLEVRVVG
jgi:hypothetical protein